MHTHTHTHVTHYFDMAERGSPSGTRRGPPSTTAYLTALYFLVVLSVFLCIVGLVANVKELIEHWEKVRNLKNDIKDKAGHKPSELAVKAGRRNSKELIEEKTGTAEAYPVGDGKRERRRSCRRGVAWRASLGV